MEAEAEKDAELEELGYTKSEDGTYWSERYQHVQYASKVGRIWVADEEALCEPIPGKRKLLIAWFDDRGRVVRWNLTPPRDMDSILRSIWGFCEQDMGAWALAEVGDDYAWYGVCAPPYEAQDDGSNSKMNNFFTSPLA